jgi:hypothetical protein
VNKADLLAQIAALTLAVQGRAAAQANAPDFRSQLTEVQQRVYDDDSDVRFLLTGRRGGKTHVAAVLLLKAARENPGSLNPYIALSRKNAKLQMWPALKAVAAAAGLECEWNEADLICTVKGGGGVICGGCDSRADIDRWRGFKFALAVVDECGGFPEWIESLYVDALEPCLLDFNGRIVFAGTPGFFKKGWWFERTHPHAEHRVHRWTCLDNNKLQNDPPDFLRKVLIRHGWTEETPSYRREYLGQWCDDEGALVFPYGAVNDCLALPKATVSGVPLHPSGWRFVFGVDVGVVDATTIAVVACHPLDPNDYIVKTEAYTGWLTGQLAQRLRELLGQCPGYEGESYRYGQIVLDTGGMGKIHAEELTRRFGLAIEAAEKREKESAIRMVRDRLLVGRVKILNGESNQALRDEWSVLGWDAQRRLPNPARPDHVSDAVLYALRKLAHYREADPKPQAEVGTVEYWQATEAAIIERRLREIQRSRNGGGRPAWDR